MSDTVIRAAGLGKKFVIGRKVENNELFVRQYNRTHDVWSTARSLSVGTGAVSEPSIVTDWHGNAVVVTANFSGSPIVAYELDLPERGVWHEILNTDAKDYGGSGVGNMGVVHAGDGGRASLVLPPLGVLWLRHDPEAHIPSPTRG